MNEFIRVRKIGEGTFGKALLVKSKKDGTHYVIKEINISKMGLKEREESRKEVKVLSKMKHPNIVLYIKSFEETGNLYIVMDYCDGGDLYKRINSQRGIYFTEDQVLDWFVQIALAIKHVHDRKILHRDIKTQNIFLTKGGTIKLGDFGIARVLRNTMELARTCIGTPYYLSPEICENRPYNNKSDVWSLGCVLYEMLTLKHAFEAGNMKNLVLKIIRGSYPPVPPRYSADMRLLVALLFKRNPHDRPSINTVLKKPFIHPRIDKFLTNEVAADEFSHTVLHRQPFAVPVQRAVAAKPSKPAIAPKKLSKPAAKYGVSVANKPAKKPVNDVYGARKIVKPADREVEKAKESDAREKRRQQLLKEQEDAYNKYMESVQKQRWQKQQMEKINRAKEQNWKNSGSILSPEKEAKKSDDGGEAGVVNMQAAQMKKYQNPGKENRPYSAHEAGRHPRPTPAWQAARQGEVNRARGAEAAERARVLEEFWQRKREAHANKNRGGVRMERHYPARQPNNVGAVQRPNIQGVPAGGAAIGEVKQRDEAKENYLAKLEAIRKQNYKERMEIQQRMVKVRGPVKKPLSDDGNGDPRVDPDARRKKIAALKAQADERAAMLKEQLEARRKAVFDRVKEECKVEAKVKEEKEEKQVLPKYQRPASASEKRPDERPVVSPVGLETALKQVGVTRLFRSHSEGDLSKILEEKNGEKTEQDEVQRKQWGAKPFKPQMLPLEVTASAMEATSANDIVIKPVPKVVANNPRPKWDHGGKVDVVSALGKAVIQPGTIGLPSQGETLQGGSPRGDDLKTNDVKEEIKKPGSWVAGDSTKSSMGVTVSVSKSTGTSTRISSPGTSSNLGVTVVKSSTEQTKKNSSAEVPSANVGRPLPPPPLKRKPSNERPLPPPPADVVKQEESDIKLTTLDIDKEQQTVSLSGHDKPMAPIKAWGEETQTSKSPKENVVSRKSYQDFLHAMRTQEGSKSPEETEQRRVVESAQEPTEAVNEGNLKIEDISNGEEQSFYETAEDIDVTALGLHTGQYDTDVKRLRTCSLPDLRLLFQTAAPMDDVKECLESSINERERDSSGGNDDDDDDDYDDGLEEVDIEIACESDEENQDYFSMLASMEDVLVSEARSPSPMKTFRNMESTSKSDDDDSDTNDDDDDDDDDDSQSSGALPLNEDWDSGDSEDEGSPEHHAKQLEEKESVFARLEESRKILEDKLGFNRFMKVYKYIQSIQDNEDDVDIGVGPAPEISDLLGPDHEHLYPKILYLVMADSAYCEDNQ